MESIKTVSIIETNSIMERNIAAIFASFGNAEVYLISRSNEKSIKARECTYQSVRAKSVKTG